MTTFGARVRSWLLSRSGRSYILIGTSIIVLVVVLQYITATFLTEIPDYGGELTEGIVGVPRFINPIISVSDADRDLVALVYSGLMAEASDGTLTPDLAKDYTVSEDGTQYTFTLRTDATFHDGAPVTAHDVVFTIELAQNDLVKSPKRANWEGVLAEALDERTVVFTLSEAFTPFLDNTTLGVLPQHLWSDINPDLIAFSNLNDLPVGSGPFQVIQILRDPNGIPYSYTLEAFDDYTRGRPYLDSLTLNLYEDEIALYEAYERGDIDSMHSLPQALTNDTDLIVPLARTFAVYFNQDYQPIFTNGSIRTALDAAVNRIELVDRVLQDRAVPVTEPLPAARMSTDFTASTTEEAQLIAEQILVDANWEIDAESGILTREFDDETEVGQFTLATVDIPELVATAEYLKQVWAPLGFDITIDARPIAELNSQVIRPREYDALLFGQVVRAPRDLFAFWHSSQRNDPGLNVAMYTNIDADAALEELRSNAHTDEDIAAQYQSLLTEIRNDVPAIFLYTPGFVYHIDPRIRGVSIDRIATPSDRLSNIHTWYRYTQHVWPLFTTIN